MPVSVSLSLTVNGKAVTADVDPRTLLDEFIRNHQALTGTHVGCEHGVCGTCTILFDGQPARSCLMFAVEVAANAVRKYGLSAFIDAGGNQYLLGTAPGRHSWSVGTRVLWSASTGISTVTRGRAPAR
jgi:hypothetical protein